MGLIYVDSCILIYAYEDTTPLGDRARERLATPRVHDLAISSLVQLECLVIPIRTANRVLQTFYEQGFSSFEQLPITDSIFLAAAGIRARFGLKTPDALHLATAQHYGCVGFWTDDNRLSAASRNLAENVIG